MFAPAPYLVPVFVDERNLAAEEIHCRNLILPPFINDMHPLLKKNAVEYFPRHSLNFSIPYYFYSIVHTHLMLDTA
jgi:hypothetical protein